ncbi:MAG: phospholipase D-like domain-containing protein [Candidatus Woesearchaeota archaeon]
MELLLALLFQETGMMQIIFCPQTDCEEFLLEHLKKNNATCAFYHVTIPEIYDLATVYVDSSNYFGRGKPIRSEGIMHHKFCILNKTHVIFSSANPTANLNHHNNMVLIESKFFVWNFKNELRRLNKRPYFFIKRFYHNNYLVTHKFCKVHDCKTALHKTVNESNSLRFLFFTFTDKELAKLIHLTHLRTNNVSGVIEGWQNTNVWAVPQLKDTPHKISTGVLQHNKLIITDKKVITGSLNPTNQGYTRNDEQIVLFENKEVVRVYNSYYDTNW